MCPPNCDIQPKRKIIESASHNFHSGVGVGLESICTLVWCGNCIQRDATLIIVIM